MLGFTFSFYCVLIVDLWCVVHWFGLCGSSFGDFFLLVRVWLWVVLL